MAVGVSGSRSRKPSGLAVVCGRVDYGGFTNGRVYVGLFADLRDVCAVASTSLDAPGEFRLEGVCPGTYYVLAGLDADPYPKAQPDAIVAYGSWKSEKPLVVKAGETVTGIDIRLREPEETDAP